MAQLADSTALVTGASSGIGAGIARMLAQEGVRLALIARRQRELERLASELAGLCGRAVAFAADLSDDRALHGAVEHVRAEMGPIDILVNCAGIYHASSIHELDLAEWDATLALNLRAPAALCAALLPSMRARKRGFVVNIASEAGALVYGGLGAYAVSKHALRVLTELVQKENQEFGIKAWAICPGWVDTAMAADSVGTDPSKFLRVEEVADLVRFLLTQPANVKMGPEILVRTMANPHVRR